MLTNLIKTYTSRLTLQLSHSIVLRHHQKRSIFDKTTYNPEWVPRVKPYSKHRKPPLKEWSDPNQIYPYYIPPLRSNTSFKHYVKNVIEKEELTKSLRKKEFFIDDIRPGDIVEITYQETFQSQSTVTYKALVLSFKRRKSLSALLEVCLRLAAINIKASYLVNSPKVKNIQIVARGSGNFRNNLKHNWMSLKKKAISIPRIRNGVMKPRNQMRVKKVVRKSKSAIEFDRFKSQTFTKVVKK